jgi:hypothetical protein
LFCRKAVIGRHDGDDGRFGVARDVVAERGAARRPGGREDGRQRDWGDGDTEASRISQDFTDSGDLSWRPSTTSSIPWFAPQLGAATAR